MQPWEQEFVDLIHDVVEKIPADLTDDQLMTLRAYIGRELSNRTMKERAQGEAE